MARAGPSASQPEGGVMRKQYFAALCSKKLKGVFWALSLVALVALVSVPSAAALTVAGVDVPETMSIAGQDGKLILNGAGIRKKFIIKVYVGALYLAKRHDTAGGVFDAKGPKALTMRFLYKKLSAEKLTDGWTDGFNNNHSEWEMKRLEARLLEFNSLFEDVVKGDEIKFIFLPGKGTEVWIKGRLAGTVAGDDFFRALLKVWLGKSPADSGLKDAMLGVG